MIMVNYIDIMNMLWEEMLKNDDIYGIILFLDIYNVLNDYYTLISGVKIEYAVRVYNVIRINNRLCNVILEIFIVNFLIL